MEKNSFKKVSSLEEASEILILLKNNDIDAWISKNEGDLSNSLLGESDPNKFEILISEKDRVKAENVFITIAKEELNHIPNDYYLFTFSEEELNQVLIEKDEWSEFDVLLSEKILNDRGIKVEVEELRIKQESRNNDLAKPEGGQVTWLIIGYISAFFGGFFGLLIGYNIWQAKNKLPNGTKVFAYNENVRHHAKIIFFISLIVFPIAFILKIYNNLNFFN